MEAIWKVFIILLICLPFGEFAKKKNKDDDDDPNEPDYEEFKPCNNNRVFMRRYEGDNENSWRGEINPAQGQEFHEPEVVLKFSSTARVDLRNEDHGTVRKSNESFHISYARRPEGYKDVNFNVHGKPNKEFPNLVKLTVDGQDICPNPKPWNSTANHTPEHNHDKSNNNEESCGKRLVQHQGLVTNGYPSQEGDWPWHAAVYHQTSTSSSYKCGGTLIKYDTVLTAAHCILENTRVLVPSRVLVKLGLHNRLISGRNTQEFQVTRIIAHNEFDFLNLQNDIAILKLATQATPSNYVHPACMWPKEFISLENVINTNGLVVGWGLNEEDTLTDILTQAEMPIVSFTVCLESNRDFFGNFLSDTNFCAGFRNGTSVCNGDSGGGMVIKRDSTYYIRGIVSLSVSREDKDICNPKQFVIFTDAAKYIDWIESNN